MQIFSPDTARHQGSAPKWNHFGLQLGVSLLCSQHFAKTALREGIPMKLPTTVSMHSQRDTGTF